MKWYIIWFFLLLNKIKISKKFGYKYVNEIVYKKRKASNILMDDRVNEFQFNFFTFFIQKKKKNNNNNFLSLIKINK